MSTHTDFREDAAIARTEALLNQAADFVPSETAPEGLATRAMARWDAAGHDCSPRMRRNFAPALSLALVGIALLCCLYRPGTDRQPASSEPMSAQVAYFPSTWTQVIASASSMLSTGAMQTQKLPGRPVEKQPLRLAYHHRAHHRGHTKTPPKAIWTVETVQTEQIGALYAAWAVQEDESPEADPDERPVVLMPVVVSVPLQNQVTTCEAPSASPFPMPPAPVPYVQPEEEPNHPDPNHPNPQEEPTQP